ncbi:MAG TPA: choice-of-anchor tandem repeat NxxGxxAF-containing protein [Phycisphaerales bacterium]|nr:choice-of-anchor tandem repeat NxxGxxAF-containing protein [Phycisphaerales bacterium]
MIRSLTAATSAALVLASLAHAEMPASYSHLIYARQNFAANPGGAYNLPGNYFNSGDTPALNDLGQVTFKLSVTTGAFQSIWFGEPNMGGTAAVGGIVYNSANDAFLGSTSLNEQSRCVWDTTFTSQNGVYLYTRSSGVGGFFFNRPLGASGWSSPQINNNGLVGFRANFAGSGQAWVNHNSMTNITSFHASEVGVDSTSPYSFLFTPSFNNANQIAGKVRRGGAGQTGESQPDEIRVFNADGSSILIAQDRDANPSSPYARFDNSVSLRDDGWVAFTTNLFPFSAGGRAVVLSNGATSITIAQTTAPGTQVSNIESFAPAANNNGLVAFRAFDTSNLRAVWVGDGTALMRIATEHDILPIDLGSARIDQNDSSPVFGGGVSINNNGDVAFNAALTPPENNQIEWGTGTFVARAHFPVPACPGDANGDRSVGLADIAMIIQQWGQTVPVGTGGDVNADGAVGLPDIAVVIQNWALECPPLR